MEAPKIDLYGFLQTHLATRPFAEVLQTLNLFRRAVAYKQWMVRAGQLVSATVVRSAIERVVEPDFQTLYRLSLSDLATQYIYLQPEHARAAAWYILDRAVCGDLDDESIEQRFPLERAAAPYINVARRQGLSAVCYAEGRRAVDCVMPELEHLGKAAPEHSRRVAKLLIASIACTLFNYTAPLFSETERAQSDRYLPLVQLLTDAVYVGRLHANDRDGIWLAP